MNTTLQNIFTLVLCGLCVCAADRSTDDFTISGRVFGPDGEPAPRASVTCRGNGFTAVQRGVTDEEGRFRLDSLPDGEYFLVIVHDRYATVRHDGVRAGESSLAFQLQRRAVIEGRVIDERTGSPVTSYEMIQLEAQRDPTAPWKGGSIVSVQNDDGAFRLENIDSGKATLMVRSGQYVSSFVIPEVKPGQRLSGVEIQLSLGATVRGTVRGVDGEPLSGILLYDDALPETWRKRHGEVMARSARDGSFVIHGLEPRMHVISAWYPGYAPSTHAVEVKIGEAESIDIVLGRGGTIAGAVTIDGQPAAGARLWCKPADSFGVTYADALTDRDGNYRIVDLSAGASTLFLEWTSSHGEFEFRRTTSKPVEIEHESITRADFALGRHATAVSGVVEEGGLPVEGAFIRVQKGDGSEFDTVSLADGRYYIGELPPGPATLSVSFTEFSGETVVRKEQAHEIVIAPDERQTLNLRF